MMDDPTLRTLMSAYQASPDNAHLLQVLLAALWERNELETAYLLLEDKDLSALPDPESRLLAARVCLGMSDPEKALTCLGEDTPAALVLRARALLATGRRDEARTAYARAIEMNSTVEDAELAEALGRDRSSSNGPPVQPARERERIPSIADDDTDESECRRLLVPQTSTVTFADVGGLDSIKKQIHRRIILPFQKPTLFQRFRKSAGGGIMLYGPPGCGKTLLARATAGECGASFYNVSIADVLDMYIGESERKLHALFEMARTNAPAVLFFDELEGIGARRQSHCEATSSKLVSQFLSEMDGFAQNNAGVLILAATNVPWSIDPAFRRPGRFDRVLFVPPPDAPARRRILEILTAGMPAAKGIDLEVLARRTSGFSGADLASLVDTATDEAIEEALQGGRDVPMSMEHLLAALAQIHPTTTEWLTTARNYARYANEAGQYNDVLEFLKRHGKA